MVCCAAETYGYGILKKTLVGQKSFGSTLEKKHHKYFLRFTYAEEVSLNQTPVKEQTICSVDLGINTDAVCTIMRPDGTILGRKFINFPSDKDRMYVCWDGFEDFSGNMDRVRCRENGHMQNV